MKKIKLVAVDIDGTLVTDQKILLDENKETLNALQNQGVEIMVSTGRIPFSALDIAKSIGGKVHYSACNGSVMFLNKEDGDYKGINFTFFKPNLIKKLIDFIDDKKIRYHFYELDHLYTNRSEEIARKFYTLYIKDLDNRIIYADPLSSALKDELKIMKVGVYDDYTFDFDKLEKELKDFEELNVCRSNKRYLDITPKGVNKWKALNQVATELGIDSSEIMYFGDEENDIECLISAGVGVSMKNAPRYVKEISDYVTEHDNNACGISKFVREHRELFFSN